MIIGISAVIFLVVICSCGINSTNSINASSNCTKVILTFVVVIVMLVVLSLIIVVSSIVMLEIGSIKC